MWNTVAICARKKMLKVRQRLAARLKTLYDVPLLFVAVRTNAGYVVAAEFIVQSEANQYIEEAINVLNVWNPEWNPKYFMCDYSDAEILALESAFPMTTTYLCDFH